MSQKQITIKMCNDGIYLNPQLLIPFQQTNLPKRYFEFRTNEDIFWKVEMLNYRSDDRCLRVEVRDYKTNDIVNFDRQEPKRAVVKLIFEGLDWKEFEPLLMHYQLSKLKGIVFNFDYDYNLESGTNNQLLSFNEADSFTIDHLIDPKPAITTIREKFWVYFADSNFMLGYVSFKKFIKSIGKEVEFKINNEHILAEFDNIKFWFSKILKTRKFEVVSSISCSNNIVTEVKSTSKQIAAITPALIDNIKYQRTLALRKEPRLNGIDKSLFTADEIFAQIDSNDVEGNVFKQSEKDILNFFLNESNIRNKKQLVYLSGKKQSVNYKLWYTLHPHFGFLFFIEGVESNHFIWELLNSHATYIWSIGKGEQNVDVQFKRIEDTINIIRRSGRENYKRAYRNNHQDNDLVFRVINHEGVGSNLVDNFPKWKSKLNEQLV